MFELKVTIEIDPRLMKDWSEPLLNAIDDGMEEAAEQVLDISKANFQNYVHPAIDTGQLLNSAVIESQFLEKTVAYRCKYAKYVEYGTAPHMPPFEPIRDWVYRKRGAFRLPRKIKRYDKRIENLTNKIRWAIFHHGTIGKPFLRPAFFIVKYRLKDIIKRHVKKAIRQIKGK